MLEAEVQLLKGLELLARLEAGSERDRLELQLQIVLGSVFHATKANRHPKPDGPIDAPVPCANSLTIPSC
jgi:hypothetical protein